MASVLASASPAEADIAPNGMDSCEVLPVGARCYERGVVPGVCELVGKDEKQCRAAGASPSAEPPASAQEAAPSEPSSSSSNAGPAKTGSCAAAERPGAPDLSSSAKPLSRLLAAIMLAAALGRRARRRPA